MEPTTRPPAQRCDATSLALAFSFLPLASLRQASGACVVWRQSICRIGWSMGGGASWLAAEERGVEAAVETDCAMGVTVSVRPNLDGRRFIESQKQGQTSAQAEANAVEALAHDDASTLHSIAQLTSSPFFRNLRKLTLAPSSDLEQLHRCLRSAPAAPVDVPTAELLRLSGLRALSRHPLTWGVWSEQFALLPSLPQLAVLQLELFERLAPYDSDLIARVFTALARVGGSSPPLRILRIVGTGSVHISALLPHLPLLGDALRVLEIGDEWAEEDEGVFERILPSMKSLHTLKLHERNIAKTPRRMAALRRLPSLTHLVWPSEWTPAAIDWLCMPTPTVVVALTGQYVPPWMRGQVVHKTVDIEWAAPLRLRRLRLSGSGEGILRARHLAHLPELQELHLVQRTLFEFGPGAGATGAGAAAGAAAEDEDTVATAAASFPRSLRTLHLIHGPGGPMHVSTVHALTAARCSQLRELHLSAARLKLSQADLTALFLSLPCLTELELAAVVVQSLAPLSVLAGTLRSLSLYELRLFELTSWSALGRLPRLEGLLVDSHTAVDHLWRQQRAMAVAEGSSTALGSLESDTLRAARTLEWSDDSHTLQDALEQQIEWMDQDPQRMIRSYLSDAVAGKLLQLPTQQQQQQQQQPQPQQASSSSSSSSSSSLPEQPCVASTSSRRGCVSLDSWLFNGVRWPAHAAPHAHAWRPPAPAPGPANQPTERSRVPVAIGRLVQEWEEQRDGEGGV